jgi:hypothetical protein
MSIMLPASPWIACCRWSTNDLDVDDEETVGEGSAVLSPLSAKGLLFALSLTAIVVPKRECREVALRARSRRLRSSSMRSR